MSRARSFLAELREQRWDDHRYYHQSRINQSLHLLSACCFLSSYVLIAIDPVKAVLLGWFAAMWSRQIGHFVFEPKGYDHVNRASQQHKEEIKVGYNLKRKVVLLALWAAAPLLLLVQPAMFGILEPHTGKAEYLYNLSLVWLAVGAGAVLFRMLQLFAMRDVRTGLVWVSKILTDPFHDVALYHKAPLHLLRGELLDPMDDAADPARAA